MDAGCWDFERDCLRIDDETFGKHSTSVNVFEIILFF
jgi:hypothetical protein